MVQAESDVAEIRKKRAVVSGKRRRLRDGRVGAKIRKLRHEGVSQEEAVATALSMRRSGRLGPQGGYRRKGGS